MAYASMSFGARRRPLSAYADAEASMAAIVAARPRSADDGYHDQSGFSRRRHRLLRPTAVPERRPDRREAGARSDDALAGQHLSRRLHRYKHAGVGPRASGWICHAAGLATLSRGRTRMLQSGPQSIRHRRVEGIQRRVPRRWLCRWRISGVGLPSPPIMVGPRIRRLARDASIRELIQPLTRPASSPPPLSRPRHGRAHI